MMKAEHWRKKEWYTDGSRAEQNQQNKIQEQRDQDYTSPSFSGKLTNWKDVYLELQ